MKGSIGTVVFIVILSLAAWVFFYSVSMPLSPPQTTFVVGICAAIVLCVKWAWGRVRKKEVHDEKKT